MRKSHPLVLKLAGAKAGEFTGIAAGWSVDRHGEMFAPGSFAESLTAWEDRDSWPPLLMAHDQARPIGVVTSAEETSRGLEIEGRLDLSNEDGAKAYALLKTGPGALGLSVGFEAQDIDHAGDIPVFTRVDLAEVSLVTVPANRDATITSVKTADRFPDRRTFEHAARNALGLSAKQAKRLAAGGWSALVRHEPEDEPNPNAQAITAALTRIATVRI